MNLPNPEDSDPLSDRGQAQRPVFVPLRLACPCGLATSSGTERGLGPASASPLIVITRQALRLGLGSMYLPQLGSGS